MEGSAGSVGRIMAPLLGVPERAPRGLRHASGSPSSSRTSSATCARTGGWTASTCRPRSASASASRRPTSTARGHARAARARRPRGARARAGCSRAPSARSTAAPASVRPGIRLACAIYLGVLDRVEALGYDVLGRRPRPAGLAAPARRAGGAAPMTRRATLRGDERTPLDERADVLICGASFAGLAVARELAGCGADVLVVDRYEIGERRPAPARSRRRGCDAMGVRRAIRQELACMSFHTPHGSARHRLPWSWSSFDYRTLCEELWEQCDARFEIAKVERRDGRHRPHRPRRRCAAPLIVDALGWRRVLGPGDNVQPPEARDLARARGPPARAAASTSTSGSTARSIRRGYAWSVPADGEQRVGVGSYEPRDHVKEPTREHRRARRACRRPLPGQLVPAPAAPGGRGRRLLRRRQRRPLLPALRRGHPHRVLLRHRLRARAARGAGRRAHRASPRSPPTARSRAATRPPSRGRSRSSASIPALPPRLLARALALVGRRRICTRAFSWYLRQADPSFAYQARTPPL